MLDEIDNAVNNEFIEETNNMQFGDVIVDRVGLKDDEKCFSDLEIIYETKTCRCCTFHLEWLGTSKGIKNLPFAQCAQESNQIALDLFCHCG